MNTVENNKIIAEFMGLELEETISTKFVYARNEFNNPNKENDYQTNFYEEQELKYHYDWNWLMQVVEKIEGLRNTDGDVVAYVRFENQYCEIQLFDSIFCNEGKTKIDAVYNTALEFINWYNQQKTESNEQA